MNTFFQPQSVGTSDATVLGIAKEDGAKIASSSQLDAILEATREYNHLNEILATLTDDNGHTAYLLHVADLKAALKSGKIQEIDAVSLEDFRKSNQLKARAAYDRMREITQELIPMAKELAEKFCKVAKRFAEESTAAEQKEYARFGLPYNPSPLVISFQQAENFVRTRASLLSANSSSHPKFLFPYLDLTK
jgi:hypothetical protein